jgi:SAM-dependent methyltransferase
MQPDEIKKKTQEIIVKHGAWTAHSIHLGNGIYTLDDPTDRYENRIKLNAHRLKRIVQVVADTIHKPLSQCRILDLGCLEGLFAIEFALQGAEVVGIEGRETNLAKAQFAKVVLELEHLDFYLDDVRNLSINKYGRFDVVFCLGILYHLNAPDVFKFAQAIADVCERVAVIDTHVALSSRHTENYEGHTYQGFHYKEHDPETTQEDKLDRLWASLDNNESFWLTKASLYNLLLNVGFTSVMTIQIPFFQAEWADREMLVAIKGTNVKIQAVPDVETAVQYPETIDRPLNPSQEG